MLYRRLAATEILEIYHRALLSFFKCYVSSTKTIITTMTATFRLVEVIAALLYE